MQSPDGKRNSTWLIIAAYNEAPRIGATLAELASLPYAVVVVDDGSTDGTAEVVRQHPVSLVRHAVNCGQGAALQTGIDFALRHGAQYIVTFDADGQHSTEDLERLLEPVHSGRVDVALGSRFLGNTIDMPWVRRWVLKAGVAFTRIWSGLHVTDTHNGLRAFSRRAALSIRITQDRMAHASEILDQIAGLKLSYCEVPVTIRYTQDVCRKGQSSWNALRIAGQLMLGRLIS